MTIKATAWQTVGPFFSIGMAPRYCAELAGAAVVGERIAIAGRVFDGDGAPIPDAVLEIWQADAQGRYAHPEDTEERVLDAGFLGHGRVATDERGGFAFTTIKPGAVSFGGSVQAPHLLAGLMMRGLLRRLTTRIYFANEDLNARDEILRLVEPQRRKTLIAQPAGEGGGHFHWDIHMQGEAETVFFEF
jgi:protocatechuate 3,4-dioxygenase alpha subunit